MIDRLLYLSGSKIPSARANTVQVMRMCAAFAAAGSAVTAYAKPGDLSDDPFAFYGIDRAFSLRRYPGRDDDSGVAGVGHRLVDRLWPSYAQLRHRPSLVLARSRPALDRFLRARRPARTRAVLELHVPPPDAHRLALLRRLTRRPGLCGLIAISTRLRDHLAPQLPEVPAERWLVAPSGAEPSRPDAPALPPDGLFHVGYTGGLYPGCGIDVLAHALIGMSDVVLDVVGGSQAEIASWRPLVGQDNVRFHGRVVPADIGRWLASFDLVAAPYQEDAQGAEGVAKAAWMSPLKLFEYMASGRAILCADLPVLREVLEHERTALLVPPADPQAWRAAIQRARADRDLPHRLASTARATFLKGYTWRHRVRAIADWADTLG